MNAPARPLRRWFDPRTCPVYYGWVILCAITLMMTGNVPGSPPGLSPYVEPMMRAFAIDRSHLTLAYMTGTVLAGFMTLISGRWFDRFDSRPIAAIAFALLGSFLPIIVLFLVPGIAIGALRATNPQEHWKRQTDRNASGPGAAL